MCHIFTWQFHFHSKWKIKPFCLVFVFLRFSHQHYLFFCSSTGAEVDVSSHQRLALGSHIAAELREAIYSKLGLTGCAGVATNKLLAKLVSGTFKPNQQTILLQEDVCSIMGSLSSLRKVPGIYALKIILFKSFHSFCKDFETYMHLNLKQTLSFSEH